MGGFSQTLTLPVNTYQPTGPVFLELLNEKDTIRQDSVLNERLLDLVKVHLTDSVLTRKTQRHQLFGAALIRLFGFRWETITWRKEKYIGTSIKPIRVQGEEKYTEFDINFDLVPHLPRYIDLAWLGRQRQKEIGKHSRKTDYSVPPFISPDSSPSLRPYKLHCELTPLRQYRPMLNEYFYPTIRGNRLKQHVNFGETFPSIGLYGPFVSDCNHGCHPEIHPYEWIWWLNVNPAMDRPRLKSWLLGLFREGSNRMPRWSPKPRTGAIALPFIFPANAGRPEILIEHLVFGPFDEEALLEKIALPAIARPFDFRKKMIEVEIPGQPPIAIRLSTNNPLSGPGIYWWIGEVNFDVEKGLVSGYLHIALSVEDLYTARVTFAY